MESPVLVKAFVLLEQLARLEQGSTLSDLAKCAHLAKPTAHRVLGSLTSMGYVDRQPGGVYRLTAKLKTILKGDGRVQSLIEAATPIIKRLHREVGETVNLGVLRGDRVEYLTVLESSHPLRRVARPSETDPFHCTALGRAIVCQLSPAQRTRLMRSARLERRTPFTVVDKTRLERLLLTSQTKGYSIEENETDLGVMCIAAAIMVDIPEHEETPAPQPKTPATVVAGTRNNLRPMGAVSLTVPTVRATTDRRRLLIAAVSQAAKEIATSLETLLRSGHGSN